MSWRGTSIIAIPIARDVIDAHSVPAFIEFIEFIDGIL
jgi:hypothetical protein